MNLNQSKVSSRIFWGTAISLLFLAILGIYSLIQINSLAQVNSKLYQSSLQFVVSFFLISAVVLIVMARTLANSIVQPLKPIAPDVGLGRLTRMEAIQAKSVNEATLQDLLAKKQNIEIRMQQIDSPGFGNCAKCGNGIAPARLAYLPESDLCVGCA